MAPFGALIDLLLQRSLKVRETLRRAAEPHLFADVIPPRAAELALLARNTDFQRHAIADLEAGDGGADGCDGAGGLVTEGERFAHENVAVGKMIVVMLVGAADASGVDGDLQLAFAGRGKLAGFLFITDECCSING